MDLQLCPELQRLVMEYLKAVQTFVDLMRASESVEGQQRLEELLRHGEIAKINSDVARLNIERHIFEHGCTSSLTKPS